MSILNKTTEELYDFSDVDETTEAELDMEEYAEKFEAATLDFVENFSNEILKFFFERHPEVNPLPILKEWIDCGLLTVANVSPQELIDMTVENIETYWVPKDDAGEDE